jgi:hypothetical protein
MIGYSDKVALDSTQQPHRVRREADSVQADSIQRESFLTNHHTIINAQNTL